jgi:hypothetical protein
VGAAKKERFANVPLDLLAVEDNASKGDDGPEEWKPPRTAYHYAYSKKWINIKHYWTLSVTRREVRPLADALDLPLREALGDGPRVRRLRPGGIMSWDP